MLLFLICILIMTILALSLFIFPVLKITKDTPNFKRIKIAYIWSILILFAVIIPAFYTKQKFSFIPDAPLAQRDKVEMEKDPELMAKIRRYERYLEKTPDDAVVWEQYAEILRDSKLYDKAVNAYRNAIRWGITADITNWHALAETIIRANNGRITAEAQKALDNVLRYRPNDPKAIYFLGLARLQNKDPQQAMALWRHLERILSSQDPWLIIIHERIKELQDRTKINPATVLPYEPVIIN